MHIHDPRNWTINFFRTHLANLGGSREQCPILEVITELLKNSRRSRVLIKIAFISWWTSELAVMIIRKGFTAEKDCQQKWPFWTFFKENFHFVSLTSIFAQLFPVLTINSSPSSNSTFSTSAKWYHKFSFKLTLWHLKFVSSTENERKRTSFT